ncbi:MAG TPA: phosphoglycolate phosphatase [Nevskiaceae bacterium]
MSAQGGRAVDERRGTRAAYDLILFDLDGTLIDSAADIAAAVNAVLAERGLPTQPLPRIRDWTGHGARETMIRALSAATGRAPDELRGAQAEMDTAMHGFADSYLRGGDGRTHVFPQVMETLEALRARGVSMALVTNKEQRLADRVLAQCDLTRFFDPIVAGDSLPRRKPDALPVRHCLEAHDVTAARALLVGDSPVDVATARAAGVACWAVDWGYSGGRPIAECHPDRVLTSFTQLAEV